MKNKMKELDSDVKKLNFNLQLTSTEIRDLKIEHMKALSDIREDFDQLKK